MRLSAHFTESEFFCPCCKTLPPTGVDCRLIHALEKLRVMLGRAIHINSGYRCRVHNRSIGGVSNSNHMKAMAADIVVPFLDVATVFLAAEKCGFGGVGLYPMNGFVHVDVGPRSRWCYGKNNKRLRLEDYIGG